MSALAEIDQATSVRFVLTSSNLAESIKFYREKLGLKEICRSRDFVRFKICGLFLDIIYKEMKKDKNAFANALSNPHFAIEVDHIRYNQIKWMLVNHDIMVMELSDYEKNKKIFFQDPDGNMIAIVSDPRLAV